MDGEKKVRNSNNGQHLLKPWFVYISQAFSVAFTVTPTLPHLIRMETETHIWNYYPGLFLSKVKVKVAQSCLTLFDPMDYIVHGIFQVRILKWVAFPFSRASSQTRD